MVNYDDAAVNVSFFVRRGNTHDVKNIITKSKNVIINIILVVLR